MFKVLKKKSGIVHVNAICQDCGWEPSNYKNGQATAAIHAKSHKHLVIGEVCIAFEYDGRDL